MKIRKSIYFFYFLNYLEYKGLPIRIERIQPESHIRLITALMPRKQEEKVAFYFVTLTTPVPQERLAMPPNGSFFIGGYCDGGGQLDELRRQAVALRLQLDLMKEFRIIGNDDMNALSANQPVFLACCLIILAGDGTG